MSVFKHLCGNCQIRIYYRRHYNKDIDWQDCPYTCEYATAMRNSYSTSIDAEPVRHGHWVKKGGWYWCSECGDHWGDDGANYCPNCGAKMDEVTDEAD